MACGAALVYLGIVCFQPDTGTALSPGGWPAHQSRAPWLPAPPFKNKPARLFLFLFLATGLLYVPLAWAVGPGTWTGFYPFDFQLRPRSALFWVFPIGSSGGQHGPGPLCRYIHVETKMAHMAGSMPGDVCLLTIVPDTLTSLVQSKQLAELPAWLLYFSIYTLPAPPVAWPSSPSSKRVYIRPNQPGKPSQPMPMAFTWCTTSLWYGQQFCCCITLSCRSKIQHPLL